MFSIIIPTCNRPDLLRTCIDLTLAAIPQHLSAQVEIVVTQDDSRDLKIDRIAQPTIRTIFGPKRGPAANRNAGADASSGKWLIFLDDDCLPTANWFVAFVKAIETGIDVYEGRTVCYQGVPSPMWHSPINETGGYLWSCNFMISREVFTSIAGFDTDFRHASMEDVDLRERLKAAGHAIAFVRDAVVDHPPRRIRGMESALKNLESYVLFSYKHKRHFINRRFLCRYMLRHRLHILIRYRVTPDSLIFLGHLVREQMLIIAHLNEWNGAAREVLSGRR